MSKLNKGISVPHSKVFDSSQKRIENTQLNKKQYIPKPYKDVASGMERQFVKHMLSEMDKSIDRAEKESSADEYYKSLNQNEFAKKITENDNLGLQDVILDQVYPKRLRNEFAYKNFIEMEKIIRIRKSI